MQNWLIPFAMAAYLFASGWLFFRARRGLTAAAVSRWPAMFAAALAVLAHALALRAAIYQPGGLNLQLGIVFSLMAWQIGLLTLLGSIQRGTANLGIALYPLLGLAVLPLASPAQPANLIQHASWQLEAHILLSVLAYGLLALAAFQAILLWLQERRLRAHQPGGLIRALPPLTIMESLLFQTLAAGFALLSLALFSGLLFIEDLFAQHLAHKTVLSILAWVVFATLLWGRWQFGWRGRTAIRWTLSGFTLLVLAYFGSRVVLELILGKSWS
ncbi:MAG: cytochrome c biogenesis protein CcsA [Gammaproteobacteria bacterium]|nr:cytochrome c biogenesis protein CcsA [Gammaproteobacteria bacterium]